MTIDKFGQVLKSYEIDSTLLQPPPVQNTYFYTWIFTFFGTAISDVYNVFDNTPQYKFPVDATILRVHLHRPFSLTVEINNKQYMVGDLVGGSLKKDDVMKFSNPSGFKIPLLLQLVLKSKTVTL